MSKKAAEFTSKAPRRQINMSDMLTAKNEHLPQPFENRSQLYLMHFFFAFVSRMWDMGIVLLIAELTNNSLFLVAVTGLCSALSIFLFMGSIGAFLDKTNRMVAVRISLLVKVVAVSVAYFVCAYLNITSTSDASADAANIYNDPFKRNLLYTLPLLGAVASMSFCAITQSIEKDWIVVLSDKDTKWLSSTNSIMTQIDLGCSSLAPALTGLLFAYNSHEMVSIVLLGVNAAAVVALYVFMSHLYHAWPALGHKVGVDVWEENNTNNTTNTTSTTNNTYGATDEHDPLLRPTSAQNLHINTTNDTTYFTTITQYIRNTCNNMCSIHDFIYSGCAGMMVSYAFLYMTVLSFGSLMTVYTRYCGVSDARIGLFRGLSALSGYLGAVIFPLCSEYLGLHNAAQVAILYQFLLVAVASSSFFWARDEVSVYVVIGAVLLSRTGLWLFDLCVRQIAQETIPESVRGKVNGQWRSMIAFFEMSAYAIAAYIPAPEDFWILTTISGAMIGLALVLFTLTNPHHGVFRGSGDDSDV